MSTNETQSVMVYSLGKHYDYKGSYPHYTNPQGEEYTPAEQREIQAQLLAERYLERDIVYCQSYLVEELMSSGADGFSLEEVVNLYPDPEEWTVEQCREYLEDRGESTDYLPDPLTMDREELEEALEGVSLGFFAVDGVDEPFRARLLKAMNEEEVDGVEEWRDAVRDNSEAAEVYEWWLVTDWLADKLEDAGEPILRAANCAWWGRCTTGQSIILDGTLQNIAKQFLD